MSCFARTNSVVSGRAAYGSGILHGVHMWLSLLEEDGRRTSAGRQRVDSTDGSPQQISST